ncbi:MAG: hypothetical protein Kow0058_07050 [Roseovarius sp.]
MRASPGLPRMAMRPHGDAKALEQFGQKMAGGRKKIAGAGDGRDGAPATRLQRGSAAWT